MFRRFLVLVLVLGLAGSASASLVGYWALDGDGMDSSGYDNHGAINGNVAPAADRFGNPNGAMSFGGDGGDNINVGNPPEFNITGAMTITAWVYLDSSSPVHGGRNARILAKMDGGGKRSWSTGIEKNVSGVPFPATIQVSSNGSDVIGLHEPTLPLDEWVHYAGVYTPGTSLEVYLNGDLAGINTDGIPGAQYSDNGNPVIIGNRPACGDCAWYGSLDEVRLYDEVLTEAQIEAVMARPEPATVVMLGLGGLALIRRKR
ncbi:MAG: PEP-CTERM sorting domain-containing protein [Phycisphaerales bacterium]|nr:MAG: PEP-CTERM sorting domain-containing protein [Phycisphaerales bacterium]